jgi:hypothetical protein
VALRLRPGIRSTVNCTLGGRRDGRFQPLSPSDRPSWSLRAPFGAGGRPPPAPKGRGGTRQGAVRLTTGRGPKNRGPFL